MTAAHFPTTAELAAFRRSYFWIDPVTGLGTKPGSLWGTINPATNQPIWPHVLNRPPRADGYEIREGIGYRHGAIPGWFGTSAFHSRGFIARREAAALRSRAYATAIVDRPTLGRTVLDVTPGEVVRSYRGRSGCACGCRGRYTEKARYTAKALEDIQTWARVRPDAIMDFRSGFALDDGVLVVVVYLVR
jgi:hypothetical protein